MSSFVMRQEFQNFSVKSNPLDKNQKLNSPTYTDSTDEPTPMNFFSQGKGFKFNGNMDEEINEGIAFDDPNNNNGNKQK